MAPGIPLRLIGTSDLHAYIYPYDYYRDRPDETVGLAKTAALISAARGEATKSLLLDNGDFLQGAPLGDYAAQWLQTDKSGDSSCHRGDERTRLRRRHTRQSRIQLRSRSARDGAARSGLSGCQLQYLEARRESLLRALGYSGPCAARRGGRLAPLAVGRHRLRHASDHPVGSEPSRGPRYDHRDRRGGPHSRAWSCAARAPIS